MMNSVFKMMKFGRNIGFLVIFGGCDGLFGLTANGSASASGGDDALWLDDSYSNASLAAEVGAGVSGRGDPVPVWVVVVVGSWWTFGGSMQAPGIQGLYAQLVGNRGQGLFQSFFFICNYTGRTLGAWAVGWVAEEYGDCTLWTIALVNYSLLWVTFGGNYHRFHPVRIAKMNGPNALRGPSGFSTAAAEVKGKLADEARANGEHLHGTADDGAERGEQDQPGRALESPLLSGEAPAAASAALSDVQDLLTQKVLAQHAELASLRLQMAALEATRRRDSEEIRTAVGGLAEGQQALESRVEQLAKGVTSGEPQGSGLGVLRAGPALQSPLQRGDEVAHVDQRGDVGGGGDGGGGSGGPGGGSGGGRLDESVEAVGRVLR